MKIFVIADALATSGGGNHIREVLKSLVKLGHEVVLYIPTFYLYIGKENMLKDLEMAGVKIHNGTYTALEKNHTLTLTNQFIINTLLRFSLGLSVLNFDRELLQKDSLKFDVIYDMQEHPLPLILSYYVARITEKPIVKLVQNPILKIPSTDYMSRGKLKDFVYSRYVGLLNTLVFNVVKKITKSGYLRGITGVSNASLEDSNAYYLKSYGIAVEPLKVSNAFDSELVYKFRNLKEKEDYAVFYARLIPAKGIRDIPRIAKKLNSEIRVFGKFDSEASKDSFLKSDGGNVEYMGFVSQETLYSQVAKAKVLIYPSYRDWFSLTLLESLALGTSSVAYDLKGIREIYRQIKPVKIVPKGDVSSMALKGNEILKMPIEDYITEHEDEKVKEFLKLHSSWMNVAKSTIEFIEKAIK